MAFQRLLPALILFAFITGHSVVSSATDVRVPGTYWVKSNHADKRTCPSTTCGSIGRMKFQDAVDVLELKNGWARVSEFVDAACVNDVSQSVVDGYNRCVLQNGVSNGKFAVWVSTDSLVAERPDVVEAAAKAKTKVLSWSKKSRVRKAKPPTASRKLLGSGRCAILQCE